MFELLLISKTRREPTCLLPKCTDETPTFELGKYYLSICCSLLNTSCAVKSSHTYISSAALDQAPLKYMTITLV